MTQSFGRDGDSGSRHIRDQVPAARVGGNFIPDAPKPPLALGISEHLDDFASAHGAVTYKQLPHPDNWRTSVVAALEDPSRRVLFNLDGVDVWQGLSRAAAGRGGATDWELLQVRSNNYPGLEFWHNGRRVGNPFQ